MTGNPMPPAPNVMADRGSVAAGRDITFGLDEEGVRRILQEELARIAEAKSVPIAPLRAVLEKLGAAETLACTVSCIHPTSAHCGTTGFRTSPCLVTRSPNTARYTVQLGPCLPQDNPS
jgi:hypothetical protein